MDFVTATEVFEAIEKFGDDAFAIGEPRVGKNCSFHTFTIMKKLNEEWKPIPLKLRFVFAKLTGSVAGDRLFPNKYPGVRLQFNRSTTSDKQGEGAYGEAKHAIAQAFNRIAKKKFGNREIKLNIQYNKKDGTAIEDPIIRVNVDYGECKPESRAKIDIH